MPLARPDPDCGRISRRFPLLPPRASLLMTLGCRSPPQPADAVRADSAMWSAVSLVRCTAVAVWPLSLGGREDHQLLSRPGHGDIAVHRPLDAGAEPLRVDQHHQIEFQPFGEFRGQPANA